MIEPADQLTLEEQASLMAGMWNGDGTPRQGTGARRAAVAISTEGPLPGPTVDPIRGPLNWRNIGTRSKSRPTKTQDLA